jgi:magnesium transporter
MAEAPGPERILLFRALPKELATDVFAHLGGRARDSLLAAFTDEETQAVLAELDPDDRTQLLAELPGTFVQRLLNFLPPGERAEARMLPGYPEESVGRLMTPEQVMVRPDWTADRALAHIRNREGEFETVSVVYVAARDGRLLDAIGLRRLVMADPDLTIEALVRGPVIALQATDDREEAVRVMARYDLPVLPVVDSGGVLLGIVPSDDVLDVIEEEVTEDSHRMAPIGLMKKSLRDAGVAGLWRARVGWLMVLVFMNILSGAGIEFFEDTLAATISLAFFLPLLIDAGGNAGSRSATLMVRALATGDVKMRGWLGLLGKEISVGDPPGSHDGVGGGPHRLVPGAGGARGGLPDHDDRGHGRKPHRDVPSVPPHPLRLRPGCGVGAPDHLAGGHRRGDDLLLHRHLVTWGCRRRGGQRRSWERVIGSVMSRLTNSPGPTGTDCVVWERPAMGSIWNRTSCLRAQGIENWRTERAWTRPSSTRRPAARARTAMSSPFRFSTRTESRRSDWDWKGSEPVIPPKKKPQPPRRSAVAARRTMRFMGAPMRLRVLRRARMGRPAGPTPAAGGQRSRATASISTSTYFGSAAASTAARAGRCDPKYSP